MRRQQVFSATVSLLVFSVIITDKLKSYGAAKKFLAGLEHRQHKGLNNRAENSPSTRPESENDGWDGSTSDTLNAFWALNPPRTLSISSPPPYGSRISMRQRWKAGENRRATGGAVVRLNDAEPAQKYQIVLNSLS